MEQKVLLPGIEVGATKEEIALEKFVDVEIKTARLVDPVSRSVGTAAYTPLPDDVEDDDLVEMDFENGERRWKQWMTVEQLRNLSQPQPSRGADGTQGEPQLLVPQTWEPKDTSRGWGTIALKALKIFGIKSANEVVDKGAQRLAAAIAEKFESQIAKQGDGHPFGLYRFTNPVSISKGDLIEDAEALSGSGPYLIFLHGTASSSVGSFGKLDGTAEWAQLQGRYGERVLALEHRTFSVSPIQNALDLANALPTGAHLHLVSHSRGGLIGELMCLAQAGESRGKFDELAGSFRRKGEDAGLSAEREAERKRLEELWELLLKKKLNVERFVRVACPAQGTTLASSRMDRLASGLLNAVGLIPGIKGNPVLGVGYDWLKSLLLTLVKKKADPRELPGIEAMIPESPLIEFLNHKDLSTQADLGVIAGDIEVGNLKLTIPALIGNAFFWAKNDLVVNTKAMYAGIRRKKNAYYFFDQGSMVCHFNYFANDQTRSRLNGWLLRGDGATDEFFRPVKREQSRSRDGQPIAEWLEQEEATVAGPVYVLEVSILHGDLQFAQYPVAVGHYEGDGIVSAEKYLDRLLNGRLADRLGMRLYPGPVGTAEVIYGEKGSTPGGALVIGLGDMSTLNTEVVKQGVTTAALRHALAIAEQPVDRRRRKYRSAAFSSLLIGTYGGSALRVREAVAAIVQGAVNANRILYLQNMWDRVRIDKIELVELYEDVAIQAVREVHALSKDQSSEFAQEVMVKVEPGAIRSVGGGRYHRPISEFETYWYGRIQITGGRGGVTRPRAARSLSSLSKIFGIDPDQQGTQGNLIDMLVEEAVKTPQRRAQLSEIITEMFTQDGDPCGGDGGLEFQVLTDRARVEAGLQGTQRRLVESLVEQSTASTRYEKDLSVSLFELLVPNPLKDRSENVVLMLDREAAQYPWELITDRTRPTEPLATRVGLLRQFKTVDFRANPRPSRGNYVMVIGDPINTGLPPLPGAKDEAEEVARLLRGAGYLVQEQIQVGGKAVINDLFAREYQILHIAAHGIFKTSNPDESGVVLGDRLFLTPKELVNLRTVPDLVFINCCHLGKFSRDDNGKLETQYPHRLAASVSEELIKIGVKAVVAAGWAVDDGAAKKFAQEFYGQMLSHGEAFGEAVKKARKATYKEFPGTNTWGAYQCYGNPNFRLNQQGRSGPQEKSFYSRREYHDELRGIAERPDVQDELSNRWASNRIEELTGALSDESSAVKLLNDGEVLADFGDAYASLGNFDKAIKYYQMAIRTKDARASLKAVEQLANLECRYALQLWEAGRRQKGAARARRGAAGVDWRKQAQDLIGNAKGLISWLLSLDDISKSGPDSAAPEGYSLAASERLSLMGKAFKCEAMISTTKAARDASLRRAKGYYEEGYKAAQSRNQAGQDWLYPATNYIACALFAPGYKKEELTEVITQGKEVLRNLTDANANFWARVVAPDLELMLRLVEGDLPEHKQKIISGYKQAFATRVKPKEADSVLGQINFLIEMFNAGGKTGKKAEVARALGEIKGELLDVISRSRPAEEPEALGEE
jgi:hypothetical protein